MFRSSLIVSGLSLLTCVASFVNQLVLARLFGAAEQMDSHLIAISLPSTVTALLVGAMGYQLVPALQRAKARCEDAHPTLRSLILGVGGASILLSGMFALCASPLTYALNPNLADSQVQLIAEISLISWLCLPLAVVAAIYTAGLHAKLKFLIATLFGSAPLAGTLIICLTMHSHLGVTAVVWGQFAGYGFMVISLRLALGRLGGGWDSAGLMQVIAALPWALLALLVFVVYPFSDATWGSRLGQSAVSYLGYAQRLLVGFSGLAVVGATTVLFPQFARHAASGDEAALRNDIHVSTRMMLACMAPCAAIFAALALPVIELLFVRGAFRKSDAENLASVFEIMLVGMVPMSTMGLAFKVFFAQNRVKTAGLLSGFGAIIYFGLSALFPILLGWKGIAVAYVVTWWVVFVLAFKLLGIFTVSLVRFLSKLFLIAATCWLSAKGLLAIMKTADLQLGTVIQLFIAAAGSSLVLAAGSLVWPGLDEGKFVARKVAGVRRLFRS